MELQAAIAAGVRGGGRAQTGLPPARRCSAQTALRVWDALLSEGAKVLYRVALALLRSAEPGLAAQDNAGDAARVAKAAATATHDRDALLKARAGRPPASGAAWVRQRVSRSQPQRRRLQGPAPGRVRSQ